MKLTWIGHACFKIENEGCSIVIDPYKPGSVPGLSDVNETANEVICTHGHGDHNGAECVEIVATEAAGIVKQLAPKKVVPMHFRSDAAGFGYDVIGPVEKFTEQMESVEYTECSVLDLEASPEAQVVVLVPANL